ncbi:hypothetical protein Xaut_0671 [Xanthobacter versatilis]|uniref:Probable membrane transporter protein n=1 Tax=Xanthobacter autotrophicus (strain ATCC BAA-1158 / Py2) TaxID=78245 RepID=A7ID30_XANP2|nr:hypothetical protein Xaut_0671 [Xanthobacter autotrophicus Py2]
MSKDDLPGGEARRTVPRVFGGGALIGTLGGLIGLGGAEFRLPLLMGAFGFAGLEAVILNKAVSLVVVATALPFRARTVPLVEVAAHWPIILDLLAGSVAGAWIGAGWATRLKSQTLHRVIAVLLVAIAGVLLLWHDTAAQEPLLHGWAQMVAGAGYDHNLRPEQVKVVAGGRNHLYLRSSGGHLHVGAAPDAEETAAERGNFLSALFRTAA